MHAVCVRSIDPEPNPLTQYAAHLEASSMRAVRVGQVSSGKQLTRAQALQQGHHQLHIRVAQRLLLHRACPPEWVELPFAL